MRGPSAQAVGSEAVTALAQELGFAAARTHAGDAPPPLDARAHLVPGAARHHAGRRRSASIAPSPAFLAARKRHITTLLLGALPSRRAAPHPTESPMTDVLTPPGCARRPVRRRGPRRRRGGPRSGMDRTVVPARALRRTAADRPGPPLPGSRSGDGRQGRARSSHELERFLREEVDSDAIDRAGQGPDRRGAGTPRDGRLRHQDRRAVRRAGPLAADVHARRSAW